MAGWFLMHRGWMQSPDFQAEPFTEREAFLWSIEQAAHSPHFQFFNGVEIAVGRGEFATSSRKMAAVFQWGDKRTRLFIARMQRRGKWAQRAAQQGTHVATILTVCNYGRFQAPAKAKGAAEGAPDGAARAQLGRSQGAQQKEGLINGNEGEAIELEASPPARAPVPALHYGEAVAAWTQAAGLKGWKPLNPALSDKRRTGLGKILKTHGLGGFVKALQRGMDSQWLGGPDPPDWFNFTFVCNPDNFLKFAEGNYDKRFASNSGSRRTGSSYASADDPDRITV